jgi:hypothetical protein
MTKQPSFTRLSPQEHYRRWEIDQRWRMRYTIRKALQDAGFDVKAVQLNWPEPYTHYVVSKLKRSKTPINAKDQAVFTQLGYIVLDQPTPWTVHIALPALPEYKPPRFAPSRKVIEVPKEQIALF